MLQVNRFNTAIKIFQFYSFFAGNTQNWALNISKNQQIVLTSIKKKDETDQNTDIKIL